MIKQDISENQAKIIYLGLGSNLGNRITNIEKAKFILLQKKLRILQSSSYYETSSWPDPKLPKYLNTVIKISSVLSPIELLRLCKEIESKLGRKDSPKNSPRECDIDLVSYKNKILEGNLSIKYLSCEIINIEVPSRLIFSNKDIISSDVLGSRFPVGSSANINLGLFINDLAIAALCCSPPESSCGILYPFVDIFTESRTSFNLVSIFF